MFEFLKEQEPFDVNTVLTNMKVADESVNVFQVQTIGESLIQGLMGSSAFDLKYRKKDIVIIIKANDSVNIKDSLVEVDPQLFFQ